MARKSEPAPAASPGKAAEPSLEAVRARIDKIDLQILALVNQRMALAAEIGRLKAAVSSGVFSPAREEEVLANVLSANQGPTGEGAVRAIFREVISAARAMQRVVKVAYLGPEYSFSHLAAVERFGQTVEYTQVGSIAAVFEEVNRRHVDFGVVPLENSTDGRIADTLDMFVSLAQEVKICAEVRLRVRHNLLANCDQPDIRRVYSKEQALSQCRHWLAKNVPHASFHAVSSTADAARLAQREPGAAAVASHQAASRFGLRIVSENIEDSPFNETRFAVIGAHDNPRSGRDKTSIMFRVPNPNSSGSLHAALGVFAAHKVNLSWVESFPYRGAAKFEYVFFVDCDGHADDAKLKKALAQLRETCDRVTVLGSFPVASAASD